MIHCIPDSRTARRPSHPFSVSAGWNSVDAPREGSEVEVYSSDHHGPYLIPFPVVFRDDRWWNAGTGEELEVYIEGWRPRRALSVGRAA